MNRTKYMSRMVGILSLTFDPQLQSCLLESSNWKSLVEKAEDFSNTSQEKIKQLQGNLSIFPCFSSDYAKQKVTHGYNCLYIFFKPSDAQTSYSQHLRCIVDRPYRFYKGDPHNDFSLEFGKSLYGTTLSEIIDKRAMLSRNARSIFLNLYDPNSGLS